MKLFSTSLLSVLAVSLLTLPASAATLDFSNYTGANNATLTTFSEDGFDLTHGILPTIKFSTTIGDAKPSLYTSLGGSIVLTHDGLTDFTFNGVDVADSSKRLADSYIITGYLNGHIVFVDPGFVPLEPSAGLTFSDIGTGYGGDDINALTITFLGLTQTTYVDNINVTPSSTPEPGSLSLLGTGILGVATMVRRRRSA